MSNFNPTRFCPSCSTPWKIYPEQCRNCGFDPVRDVEDRKLYYEAVDLWYRMKKVQEVRKLVTVHGPCSIELTDGPEGITIKIVMKELRDE